PQHQIVLETIKNKYLGKIKKLKAHFAYDLNDTSNIRLKRETAGGALYDVGCYTIDCAEFITGSKISSITAHSDISPKYGVDIYTEISAIHKNNIESLLICGCKESRANYYELICERG